MLLIHMKKEYLYESKANLKLSFLPQEKKYIIKAIKLRVVHRSARHINCNLEFISKLRFFWTLLSPCY